MGNLSGRQLNRCILPIAGWLSTFTLGLAPAWGQITPTGSSVITHDGLSIQVQGGTPSADGANLFHQFEAFSISTPESVTFVAPTSIENILARVSGGQASVINGSLRSSSAANLWLINPAGILFGNHAQLDIQGDFTAATADAIGFEQGWFSDDANYQNLVGPPRRFAFLSAPANLVNLGNLQVAPGQNLQLLGGQVINAGTLSAPEGIITVAAIADTNRVNLSHTGQVLSLEIEPVTEEILTPDITPLDLPELLTGQGGEQADTLSINADGTLQLGQSTAFMPEAGDAIISDNLSTVGEHGGQVTILGNRVALVDATIRTDGMAAGGQIYIGGNYQGQGPLPNATQTMVNTETVLSADALGQGNGGEIIVWAHNATSFNGTATARGGPVRGDGGFIEISGKSNLEFTGGFDVSAPQGEFGTVLFDPDNIEIVNGAGVANGDTELGNPVVGTIIAQDNDGGWFTIHEETLETWNGNANIVLQANTDIIVRNLGGDNTLSFQPGAGSIEFIADADDNGIGQFLMERAGDLIETAGRNLSISAGNRITLESIDTRSTTGGTAGNVRLAVPGGVDIRNTLIAENIVIISDGIDLKTADAAVSGTTLSIATDDPTLNIHLGSSTNNIGTLDFEQNEILAIQEGFTNIFIGRADGTGTITLDQSVTDGGANPFQDPVHILGTGTLRIPEQDTTWTITGERQGNLDSLFSNGLSFENINSIVGNATTNDTLQGFTGNDTVEISGINAGTFNGIAFANIENLEGNGGDDSFTFANGAAISGTLDGGAGNNTLDYSAYITDVTISLEDGTAPGTGGISNFQSIIGGGGTNAIQGTNGNDTITLTNVGTGSINDVNFQGFDRVTAGDGNDRFLVNDGSWNQLDGGAGNDTLDYSGNPNGVTIDLLNQTTDDVALFSGIENFQGSNGVDTLLSTNGNDAISIIANNTGTLGTQTFSDIENIDARNGNDTISFSDGASIAGSFTGGDGIDTINYNNYTTDLTIDLQTRQSTGIADGFDTVESLIGGNGNDTFRLDDINPIQTIDGGAGDNTLLGSNTDSTWNLTDVNTGNGPGVGNFSNIQNFTAGNQADQINILANGARFTGELDGAEGLLTLTGDSLGIGTDLTGTGELILQPTSPNRNIRLGGPGLTADLDISTAELSNIRPGFSGITIGRPDGTGRITLGDDVTFSAPVTIQTPNGGGSIDSAGYDIEATRIILLANQNITTASLTAADLVLLESENGSINTRAGEIDAIQIELYADQNITTANLIAADLVSLVSDDGSIDTRAGDIDTGEIILLAAQDITTANLTAADFVTLQNDNGSIDTRSGDIDAGEIYLLAAQDINTANLTASGGAVTLLSNGIINTQAGEIDAVQIDLYTDQDILTANLKADNDVILQSSNGAITTQSIDATDVTIAATQAIVTDNLTAPDGVAISSDGSVTTTNINTRNTVNGGNVTITAGTTLTTQQIDTTGITGTGGDVALNAPSTIQVDSIRTEGDIAGGNVAISTEEFFRATNSFTSLNNTTASISTESNSGTGSITIRHGGNGVTPFEVGNGSLLGTNGFITSGPFQIDPNSSFLNSHTLGNIALITQDLFTSQINVFPPSVSETPPTPPLIRENLVPLDDAASALGAEDYNSRLFERLETSYSEQFKSHLNLYERVSVSPTSLESAKTTLGNVERVLGVKPGVLYVYFLPSKHKHTALPNPDAVNLDDELGLLLLTHEGQTIRKKIEGVTRADVMEVAENFSSQITNSISTASQYLPPAQQLYNWFISPLEEALEEQKIQSLAMVMDTGLRTLPVAALHDGDNFLIERYSLGVIPSFSLTDFNPENFLYTQLDNTHLLAMGASQFPSQQQLPAVPDELEMITEAFPNSEVFLNDGFTLDNLKNNVSNNNFGIVHLASHGVFEPGAPRNSYIQLWDQHLQLDQVHTLGLDKADIALMVLSACNTAIGDREAEYGFAGLAVNAGVQTSVASLWPISDEGTLGLMTYFYNRLQEQPVRATALRQAQLAMAQGELHFADGTLYGLEGKVLAHFPELEYHGRWNFEHPFYWSTYTLVGSPW